MTVVVQVSPEVTMDTWASWPGRDAMTKVVASGTGTWANAGFGLGTVRTQIQAITGSDDPATSSNADRPVPCGTVTGG